MVFCIKLCIIERLQYQLVKVLLADDYSVVDVTFSGHVRFSISNNSSICSVSLNPGLGGEMVIAFSVEQIRRVFGDR